ncbi:MAG: small ribosomal subunit Rsm22 family protein [Acidobacteriota bacterium]
MSDWLTEAETRAARHGSERMRAAVESLTTAYRSGKPTPQGRLDEDLLASAYLAVRFPATLAANHKAASHILDALAVRAPGFPAPCTLLDLGAGCGAATLAALSAFPSLITTSAIEPLGSFAALGQQFLPGTIWRRTRFDAALPFAPHDLVWASYSLGELPHWQSILAAAWQATTQILVILEPGTPHGASNIQAMRTQLLAAGAHILAPCPSSTPCPLGQDDWCHFAARLNRTALHRRLKDGALGYEDEKFSWLAAVRTPLLPGAPRILRHPLIEPGRISLSLCTAPTLSPRVITKRDKAAFRLARKSSWGDNFS